MLGLSVNVNWKIGEKNPVYFVTFHGLFPPFLSSPQNKWKRLQHMPTPRASAAVTSLHGHLYVMGGRSRSRNNSAPPTLDNVEVYDPETDSWMELGPMPTARCEAAVAVI